MNSFHYLRFGISAVLIFVGAKMLSEIFRLHVPIGLSLGVVGLLLLGSVVASLLFAPAAESDTVPEPQKPAPSAAADPKP